MTTNPTRAQAFDVVVFDFDGTLVDSNGIKREAYFEVASAIGISADIVTDVLATVVGDRSDILREIVRRSAMRTALPEGHTVEDWSAQLVADYTALCKCRIARCPAIPGSLGALPALQAQGTRLYVNSATPLDPLSKLIRLRGLDPYFHGLYGAPAGKVENLEAIRRREDVPFPRMLMVGDGEDDRRAAQATGCGFVGVVLQERRFAGESDLVVLSDLSTLPEFVAGPTLEGVA